MSLKIFSVYILIPNVDILQTGSVRMITQAGFKVSLGVENGGRRASTPTSTLRADISPTWPQHSFLPEIILTECSSQPLAIIWVPWICAYGKQYYYFELWLVLIFKRKEERQRKKRFIKKIIKQSPLVPKNILYMHTTCLREPIFFYFNVSSINAKE